MNYLVQSDTTLLGADSRVAIEHYFQDEVTSQFTIALINLIKTSNHFLHFQPINVLCKHATMFVFTS